MMACPSSKTSLVQANLHHSETASAQLRKWLEVQRTAIALIQEPWVGSGKIKGLNNLKGKLFYSSEHDKPRACIYTTKDICAQPLTDFCSRDMYAVAIQYTQESRLVVASVYMPEEDTPPPHDLSRLVNFCERTGLEVVIGTDSNAHHPLWGMEKPNERGKVLVEYLFSTNLTILNIGSEPTFINKRCRTIIDLTLATEGAAKLITGWHVSREASCSDHRWICFALQVDIPSTPPWRNPRKTDKTKYLNRLTSLLADFEGINTIADQSLLEEQVAAVTKAMIDSYHESCPEITPPRHAEVKQPWWGKELDRKRKKVRKALNRAMNTSMDEDWLLYKKAKSEYKKCIRYRRSIGWRKFCGNIETCKQANRIRNILAKQNTSGSMSLKKPDGSYSTSPDEAQRILIETHFPGCCVTQEANRHDDILTSTAEDWNLAQRVVTMDKIHWAIHSFLPYKAAGPDGIFPALLQWGDKALIVRLAAIMRACLALKYVPRGWREVKVTFIPKPGKSDYTDPKSYRPISLTSFLLKTMERMCERELRGSALMNLPLHDKQHANSLGKSTESALHKVITKIEEAIQNKEICLGSFIDIEGAFDRTNFSSIKGALGRHKVEPALIDWIVYMLSTRIIKIAGESQPIQIKKGCPQGGVLSPLLWNMVINELISKLNDNHFYTVGYADDLTILVSGKTASIVCDLTQAALRIRLACMAATGCMRTTPTAALEAMLELTPLHLHIQQEATLAAIRLKTLNLWSKNSVPHTGIIDRIHSKIPILQAKYDRIPKQFVFDKKYKIQLNENSQPEGLSPKELRIFTDGSKTNEGVGCGAFSEDLNIHICTPLGTYNTVFQAECMGIIQAAIAIDARKVNDFPIRILTDSRAVLQALRCNVVNSGLIYECHQRLNEVCKNNNVTLQWIKGHSGSRGNDAADELARRGSALATIGPEPIIPIPFGNVCSLVRRHFTNQHAQLWKNLVDCRQARDALPEINSRLTKVLMRLNKPQIRIVTSAITGHGTFNKHLFTIGVTDSPLCRACMGEEETAAHVLLKCPEVATYRAKHLGTPGSLPEVACNIKGLLSFFGEISWLE
ncbi:unnamed protein product [Parnassius mnemosyne]|uniref:Uncharacterized protein n=1 Tax=Parnassius mnemosyne TaxID=213953 RepID=A0AAV1LTS0_9NEOP